MKIVDKITEALGLYDEEDIYEEELEQEAKQSEEKPKRSLFAKKNITSNYQAAEEPKKQNTAFFKRKSSAEPKNEEMGSKTIALPLADKQVKVVVLEPTGFDDSQKIADYLRNKQPVVVNFDNTDSIVTKRMTDFISGTIYALGGSMKKIGHSILVCAPKNVDIDAGSNVYDEKGRQPWDNK